MGWEGFTGRAIQTDTGQWRKPVLKYFIKNSWVFISQDPREDPLNEKPGAVFHLGTTSLCRSDRVHQRHEAPAASESPRVIRSTRDTRGVEGKVCGLGAAALCRCANVNCVNCVNCGREAAGPGGGGGAGPARRRGGCREPPAVIVPQHANERGAGSQWGPAARRRRARAPGGGEEAGPTSRPAQRRGPHLASARAAKMAAAAGGGARGRRGRL
ncbi:uncharacterized protein LOC131585443 isoform X1 [Poecile atricapillus]|uniref:uncharacterized protein LOC131585443 isoform X1 n=1 Tax=Poecile atricapillus TaxID=48891 RepID=UPI002738A637|nr:uncharacterized protein LOC131585443 isoform X1 [Poecile atricapillus]